MSQTKEQQLQDEADLAVSRWKAHNGGDGKKAWQAVVRPLVDRIEHARLVVADLQAEREDLKAKAAGDSRLVSEMIESAEQRKRAATESRLRVEALETERDSLAAEVKRLKETAEHLGANLKTARADLATQQNNERALSGLLARAQQDAAAQRRRADRLAGEIDALVECYSDLQRGAR